MEKDQHESWIDLVIRMAERNAAEGEGPFAAIVVHQGEMVSAGVNRTVAEQDPCAHAELTAVREACKQLKRADLSDCTLYASGEPCPMCMGAIYWAKLGAVYYACSKEEAARDANFGDPLHGFSAELARPPAERAIAFHQVLAPSRLEPFKIWRRNQMKA